MTLLSAREVRKAYGRGDALVRAVDDVDLDVGAGETAGAARGPLTPGARKRALDLLERTGLAGRARFLQARRTGRLTGDGTPGTHRPPGRPRPAAPPGRG